VFDEFQVKTSLVDVGVMYIVAFGRDKILRGWHMARACHSFDCRFFSYFPGSVAFQL